MKFVQEKCSICRKSLAMLVVQEDEKHSNLIWVQCPTCKEIKPLEIGPGRALKKTAHPTGEAGDERVADPRRLVRHYRAGERFATGEWIYHAEFKDTGQVLEVLRSSGGKDVIVVAFEKRGTTRLVSNFAG